MVCLLHGEKTPFDKTKLIGPGMRSAEQDIYASIAQRVVRHASLLKDRAVTAWSTQRTHESLEGVA